MVNAFVQFRIEEEQRAQASAICERLCIDLATYLRICIAKLIRDDGVPFSMRLSDGEPPPEETVIVMGKRPHPARTKAAGAPGPRAERAKTAERPPVRPAAASRSAGIVDMSMD